MAETQKATVVFGVLNETSQDETRVALTPDIVTRLKKAGVSCLVQSGAGIAAQYTDDDYAKAGAEVVAADDVIARADVLGFVDRPSAETVARLKAGTWVIGMLGSFTDAAYVDALQAAGLVGVAMEKLPRQLSSAQSMDEMTSQNSVMGYKAALVAANAYGSFFPMMTNSVIRSFAWINILGSNGIINKAMIAMGLIEKPMKLLYTDFSIIIGSVYLFLPLMIVTVAGVMENIDDDMMEAAQSLGASRSEAFMKVIFPMSLPGIIVGGILVFTGTLTAYTTPQLLGGNSNMVMATLIYQRAMSVSDWTGASVIALIMIVVTLVVIKGFNALAARLDRRGEDYA